MKSITRTRNGALLAAVALAALSGSARATTRTYVGADNGNWNVAGNWSPVGVPASNNPGDDVVLGTHSAGTNDLHVSLNTNANTGGFNFNSVTLNSSGLFGFMIVNQYTGGSLGAITENIGTTTSENTYNLFGGMNAVQTLNMGGGSTNNNYNISAAGDLEVSLAANIGLSGGATVNQTGGTFGINNASINDTLTLGVNATGFGTYNLSFGSLSADYIHVGSAGGGAFSQSGGSVSCYFLTVASTSSAATYSFSGGTLTAAGFGYGGPGATIGTNGKFNLNSGGSLTVVPVVNPGGTFNMAGGSFGINGGLDLEGGTFQLQGNSVAMTQFYGGSGTVQNGMLLPAVLSLNMPLPLGSPVPLEFFGIMQDGPAGTLGLTIAGGGFLLGGANTYSGPTTVQAGLLQAGADNAFSPNSNVTVSGGTLDASTFNVAIGSLAGTGGVVNVGGHLSIGSTGLSTLYAGTLTGTGTVTKSGGGNLSLAGGGSFTGTINIQSGSLTVGAANGIPTGATVNLNSGTLNVNANQTLAGFFALPGTSTSFSGNSTLTVGTGNTDTIHSAQFTGAGTLIKVGTGTFTLGLGAGDIAPNADTPLIIDANAGTLKLNKAPGTDAVAGPLNIAGGTVLLAGSNQIDDASVVTLASGTFNLAGFSETIGGLSGTGGSIALGSGTLTVAQAAAGVFGGGLTGPGAFIKTGAADLTLTGAAGYTGTFTVNNGRLILPGLVSAAGLTANSGGTIHFDTSTVNLGGGQILTNAGGTAEYLGTTISNGFLRGTGTHVILPGPASTFNGLTTFNSTAITQNGPALFNNFTNGGTLNNNALLTFNGVDNSSSGIINVNNTLNTQDFTSNGLMNIVSGASLINSTSNLVLGGGARLYIGTAAAPGGSLTLQNSTTLEVNGALVVNSGAINGNVNVHYGGTVKGNGTFNGTVNLFDGAVWFPPGSTPFAANSLTPMAAASAVAANLIVHDHTTLNPGSSTPGVGLLNSLQLDPGATMDMRNNDLVLLNQGPGAYNTVRQWILSGQLSTSLPSTNAHPVALAPIDNQQIHQLAWNGQTISDGSSFGQTIVEYTYLGDVNGDGKVDQSDLYNVIANMNHPGTWTQGDVDLDGMVTLADLQIVLANLGAGDGTAGNPPLLQPAVAAAPVPEPAALLPLAACASLLIRRRYRRA
ncbi:MAG: beta strand repeat-containing protein [Tepidisphaerales bacterium]